MPDSSLFGKVYIGMMLRKFFEAGFIRRIVDVGAGSGTYRKLLGQDALEITGPKISWVAVEAWTPNIGQYALTSLYDDVLGQDVREIDFVPLAPSLVLFGDVLEHMPQDDAKRVVERAVAVAPYVMISIPVVHYPQGELYGNPYERHVKDDWTHEEVCESFPATVTGLVHDHIGVYFLSRQPEAIRQLLLVHDVVSPIMTRQFGAAIRFSGHI